MLKNKRKKLGISQRKLGEKLKLDRSYISKVENGKFTNVSLDFIKKISKELDLCPVDVFSFFLQQIEKTSKKMIRLGNQSTLVFF